jgi:ABC-2 type transport system ATP-binding protein
MPTDTVIAAHGLAKHYRDVCAVDGIDLSVLRGEISGFLGRNGTGKTMTIRMLLGLIRPTAGNVAILGSRIGRDEQPIFAHIGYLVETATA